MPTIKTYGPAACSAALLCMAFPSWSFYPLAWIALIPLLWKTSSLPPAQAAKHFLLFGWLTHAFLLRWVLIHVFWVGGWAMLGNVLLALYYGLFWGVLGFSWRWIGTRLPKLPAALLIAVLWAGLEQIQTIPIVTYGCVGSLAYSQGPDLALLQLTALGGTALVAFVIVLSNAGIAMAIANKSYRLPHVLASALVLGAAHGIGAAMIGTTEYSDDPLTVGIFQSNFSIEMKHDPEYREEMIEIAAERSLVLDAHESIDLMLWPEALIMNSSYSPTVQEIISGFTEKADARLFTGAARHDGASYNSSYYIDTDGSLLGTYDKMRLAPFGEYVPFGDTIPFLGAILGNAGSLAAGEVAETYDIHDRRFGPLICFEVFFPSMSQKLIAKEADSLVVVTNLAWFGVSHLVLQEFHVARIRAIENRVPLIHASNTGISGVFDPYGRFKGMKGIVDQSGTYRSLREDLRPQDTIQHRLVGAFELPDAVESNASTLSAYTGWIFTILSGCILLVALATGRATGKKK